MEDESIYERRLLTKETVYVTGTSLSKIWGKINALKERKDPQLKDQLVHEICKYQIEINKAIATRSGVKSWRIKIDVVYRMAYSNEIKEYDDQKNMLKERIQKARTEIQDAKV